MKKVKNISLLLTLIGILFLASESNAQVTATATVTVTVIPAPGLTFTPTKLPESSAVVASNSVSEGPGVTFRSSNNVSVQLSFLNGAKKSQVNFQQDEVKTFTAKELRGVSSVQIVYLGS